MRLYKMGNHSMHFRSHSVTDSAGQIVMISVAKKLHVRS